MDSKAWLFQKLASKTEKVLEVAKAFSEKKASYPQKITAIKNRLLENYKFWASKTNDKSKARLEDIERDTNFIKSIQNRQDNLSNTEKERIDLIIKKHSVSIY
jgi:hypothetical protein